MNARQKLVVGSSLLCGLALACSSTDQSGLSSTGGTSGAQAGGTSASGAGAGAGQAAQGGDDAAAGSSSIAGTTSATGGSAGSKDSGTAGASGGDKSSTAGGAAGGAAAGGAAGSAAAGAGGAAAAGTGGTESAGTGGAGGSGGSAPAPLLQNGSFEGGGLAPWQVTVTPADVGKAIYTQWGPGGVSVDGKYEVSFWNGTDNFVGDLHQTVTGLTPGKYRLTLYLAYGSGLNAAYLYAIGCGPQDAHIDLPLTADWSTFTPTSIPSIDVTETSCTVGIYADMNTGNWLNADDFVFELVPPS